jgi:hypothetical protein
VYFLLGIFSKIVGIRLTYLLLGAIEKHTQNHPRKHPRCTRKQGHPRKHARGHTHKLFSFSSSFSNSSFSCGSRGNFLTSRTPLIEPKNLIIMPFELEKLRTLLFVPGRSSNSLVKSVNSRTSFVEHEKLRPLSNSRIQAPRLSNSRTQEPHLSNPRTCS